MYLYASNTADPAEKLNASTLLSDLGDIDLTGIIAPTEVIGFPDSASHAFISSGTHPFTIAAADVVLCFSGGLWWQ